VGVGWHAVDGSVFRWTPKCPELTRCGAHLNKRLKKVVTLRLKLAILVHVTRRQGSSKGQDGTRKVVPER
jgi:hypothetical protein